MFIYIDICMYIRINGDSVLATICAIHLYSRYTIIERWRESVLLEIANGLAA